MAEFLALRDIVKIYGTTARTTALRGVSLSLAAGEYAALIGRSGSGKSTLLNIIGTLDRPTSGEMRVDGRDIFALDDDGLAAFRGRTIGFVFQFHHLLPEFTALENVLLPFRAAHGRTTAATSVRARRLLERVGVGDRMNHKSNALSGGQQQRVAIARALINEPRLILADEPTGNLDTESSEAIKALLREINRESGTTFLIVTHDRHIAAGCDRVVEIDDGGIVRDFRPPETTADEAWAALAPCECRERVRGDGGPAPTRP
ncbi:MAG: Lipoprotein-releasing system ATP-binding protein LolD [Candidatus Aminicenantes bacterium ADurb.Bin147]|nr:MAG: Lipoprotein-releasing system ATP-binding protein LolD [Candidatus Aminicenantes bacterium ADurb.Bin147]